MGSTVSLMLAMRVFKLQLDPPPGDVYYPGMVITGTISGYTDEPKNYKAIQVRLIGQANVFFTDTGVDANSSSILYINRFTNLWHKQTSAGGGQFPIGHFQFPFSIQLVGNQVGTRLPPSYYSGPARHGCITYTIEARVFKQGPRCDLTRKKVIKVANKVSINKPDLMQPLQTCKTVRLCCASGPIVITASIPRKGYCKNDAIPVKITVQNESSRNIGAISVALQKVVRYRVGRNSCIKKKKFRSIVGRGVRTHGFTEWRPLLPVTDDIPVSLLNCGIINMSYNVCVLVSIWGTSPTINLPVVIGNVPLDEEESERIDSFGYQPSLEPPTLEPTVPLLFHSTGVAAYGSLARAQAPINPTV